LSNRILRTLLLSATLTAGLIWAQTQANTGTIEGTVLDQRGSSIPGARVTLLNADTNFARDVTTDSEGRFHGLLLPLGAYKVTVRAANFGALVREGISLAVGQAVHLNLTLTVAAIEQTITIDEGAPIVETTRVERSSLIDNRSIRSLPNNGRNFLDFVTLTPGVAIVQGPDGNEISINGQKGIHNNVSIDGADNNNPFFGEQRGGQRPPFTVNLDAVQEFQVVADGAPAEFGRSSSGFINVVTKSGTNQLHGAAHLYQRFTGLTSRLSDGTRYGAFSQEQFGGALGGPIRKNKLFFFGAYDQQIFRQTKQNNPARIDPVLVDFFATKFGSPNENGPIRRTADAQASLAKIDWHSGARNFLTLRHNFSNSRQENGTFDVDPYARSANAIERDFAHTVNGAINSAISPTLLNEFRAQFSREDRPREYSGPQIPGQNRPFPDTGIGPIGYRFGLPFFIPVVQHDTRFQLNENLSVVRGAHNLKFGFEFNRTATTQTFIGFANGRYIFSSAQGFMNYVNIGPRYVECSNGATSNTGQCPAGASITGPLLLFLQFAGVGGKSVNDAGTQTIPQTEPAFFAQDRWQIRRNLTLSYGLRWEAQIQPAPLTPPSEVFYSKFIGRPGFPSDGTIPSDLSQWQPRLGLTWDPSGRARTVIRLSGGVFNARTPGLTLASTRSTNGSIGQTIYRDSTFNGFGLTPPAYTALIPDAGAAAPDHPQVFVFDRGYRNPRTYAWSATLEQALTPTLKIFTAFNYAKGVHIARFVNRNDPVFGSPWSTGLGADGRNGIGDLTTVESSAKSLFRGWTTGMTKQFSNRVQFQWNYQLSADWSDDDQERDPFNYYYRVANDFRPEYSYSARDQRHRFNFFGQVVAPWGVEISPRYSARSAQPTSIDGSNRSVLLPNGTVEKRNTARKDNAYSSFDVRVAKRWQFNERFRLEGAIDAFNLFNSKNLKQPQNGNLLFNFDGTLTSGLGDPRQAQLGVKLLF
jgi:hypothetical protein